MKKDLFMIWLYGMSGMALVGYLLGHILMGVSMDTINFLMSTSVGGFTALALILSKMATPNCQMQFVKDKE